MTLERMSQVAQAMSAMPGVSKELMTEAKAIIAAAEADLGVLTLGQRRDLLKDNTDWSAELIYILVEGLRTL